MGVIETTDQIWNMYRDFDTVEFYLREYMADDWESITSMGEYLQGMDEVIRLVNIPSTPSPTSSCTLWTPSVMAMILMDTRPVCLSSTLPHTLAITLSLESQLENLLLGMGCQTLS